MKFSQIFWRDYNSTLKHTEVNLIWIETNFINPFLFIYGDCMNINLDDVEYITETSLTIRGTRRRTTVPKAIVDRLDLLDGEKIRWFLFKDGNIVITKVTKK